MTTEIIILIIPRSHSSSPTQVIQCASKRGTDVILRWVRPDYAYALQNCSTQLEIQKTNSDITFYCLNI